MEAWTIANLADRALFAVSDKTLVTATAVALAESGGNEKIVSPVNSDGSTDVGLWQINSVHRRDHPTWTTAWLQNPANNASAMAVISSNGSNWAPWSAYKNGKYKQYLTQAQHAVDTRPIGAGVGQDTTDFGDILEKIPGVGAATTTLDVLKELATTVGKASIWVADVNNWMRIAQVVGGIALGLVAVVIIAKPVLDEAKGFL